MNKPEQDFQYIDHQEPLDQLTAKLIATDDEVAIDIEADSLYHYYHKVCLLQLTFDSNDYIVDPLAGLEFDNFYNALSEKDLILHNGDYDLRMMRSSFGFKLKKTFFDTMVAARLLGYEHYSLATIVNDMFDFSMSKKGQKSDWSRRPLSDMQVEYAVYDTRFLKRIADDFRAKLLELNRLHWLEQCCDKLMATVEIDKPDPDPDRQWRIKGIKWFNPRQLALVKNIWLWREEQAQITDVPPFKVMGNQLIIDLAIWKSEKPYSKLKNADCPRLPRNCSGDRFRSLGKAIKDAFELKIEDCPQPIKSNFVPRPAGEMFKKLKDSCQEIADDLKIDSSVLAPRAALTAISRNRPTTVDEIVQCSDLLPWQAELINDTVQDLASKYPPELTC
ncbi:MAG: HRDC domain-containing protein [Phycisphaerae bacterium]|nr:HRDC domain-containing protein [Phycisphaerae bacterium]